MIPVVLALLGLLMLAPPAHAQQDTRAERVLVVAYPRLTWELVDQHRPPALLELAGKGAVASTSVRTLGPRTTAGEGYATIGAGARAGVEEISAGLAMEPDDPFEGGRASDAFRRRTGAAPDGNVLHLGIAGVRKKNAQYLYDASPGLLGATLKGAGLQAAVIANADQGRVGGDETLVHREATLAVMDRLGRVPGGAVDASLLVDDPASPFGVRVAADQVVDAVDAAWLDNDVVLVEMSDLERADAYKPFATAVAGRAAVDRAVADADRLLARLLRQVDLERDLVVVVAPAAPRSREELTVAMVAGPGIEPGKARSATTRRPGFVTLPDVAPTVLRALGADKPDDMVGSPITSAGGEPLSFDGAGDLADVSERAVFRDRAVTPIAGAFVAFQLVTYALAAVAIVRRLPRLRAVAAFMALVTLGYAPLVFLSALVPYEELTVAGYMALLFAGAVALAWLARPVGDRLGLAPPIVLISLTFVVLMVDVFTGTRLQINTVFGYSPIIAGRFAGYGNQAFALVSMGAVVISTALWGRLAERGRGALVAAGAVLVLAVVADGHPALGADVGGVLALVPAAAVVMLLLAGARLGVRRVLLVLAATALVLATFALIDVARPSDSQTHLGRLVERLGNDGGGELLTVIQRKASANLRILVSSIWSLIIPVAVAFFAMLTWRQPPLLRQLQETVPGLRICLIGGLIAGALGFAANDSGVAVPAVMLGVVLPYVTYLAVTVQPGERVRHLRPAASGP